MKNFKRFFFYFTALFLAVISLFLNAGQTKTEAAVVDNVLTNVSLQNSQGGPLTNGVGSWENFQMNADFAFNNGEVQPGDTATVQLPQELMFVGKSFEIRDGNGQVVANATIDSTSKQAVLTFTNYVTERASFTGNFNMTVRVDHNVVRTAQQIPLTVTVNRTPMNAGVVNYTGIAGMEPQDFAKSGWQDPNDDSKLHYIIYFNQNYLNFSNVVISDTIQFENATINKGSFKVLSGIWYTDPSDNSIRLGYQEDVTASYSPQFSADGKSFTLNLQPFNPNRGYYVKYDVDLVGAPDNGTTLNNNARFEDANGYNSVADAEIVYQANGGSAQSNIFTVELTKKSESGEKLQGAEFGLYFESTLVKSATSDANGVVTFDGLIKPKYTIKETKAPAGYVLSEEEITINSADATNHVIRKDVVNKAETTTTTTTTTEETTTSVTTTSVTTEETTTEGSTSETTEAPTVTTSTTEELPNTGVASNGLLSVVAVALSGVAVAMLVIKRKNA